MCPFLGARRDPHHDPCSPGPTGRVARVPPIDHAHRPTPLDAPVIVRGTMVAPPRTPPVPVPGPVTVNGVHIPTMVYGTAWKEDRTESLVAAALDAGFRGIDTANQRRHYNEAGVGDALRAAFAAGTVGRNDLFLQTKFTYMRGQDHRLPYDPHAPPGTQVEQSVSSSLDHLGVDHIDAYLLHGPAQYPGLSADDHATWQAMEAVHDTGRVRLLGISNVMIDQLTDLHACARVKPTIVQNRTFTRPEADRAVRTFCRDHGIVYEGFSLLTAIPGVLAHPTVVAIAARTGRTVAEVILRFCLARGMIVLTGTTSREHMAQDLAVGDMELSTEEMASIDRLVT